MYSSNGLPDLHIYDNGAYIRWYEGYREIYVRFRRLFASLYITVHWILYTTPLIFHITALYELPLPMPAYVFEHVCVW